MAYLCQHKTVIMKALQHTREYTLSKDKKVLTLWYDK